MQEEKKIRLGLPSSEIDRPTLQTIFKEGEKSAQAKFLLRDVRYALRSHKEIFVSGFHYVAGLLVPERREKIGELASLYGTSTVIPENFSKEEYNEVGVLIGRSSETLTLPTGGKIELGELLQKQDILPVVPRTIFGGLCIPEAGTLKTMQQFIENDQGGRDLINPLDVSPVVGSARKHVNSVVTNVYWKFMSVFGRK